MLTILSLEKVSEIKEEHYSFYFTDENYRYDYIDVCANKIKKILEQKHNCTLATYNFDCKEADRPDFFNIVVTFRWAPELCQLAYIQELDKYVTLPDTDRPYRELRQNATFIPLEGQKFVVEFETDVYVKNGWDCSRNCWNFIKKD
jgi:hypothetical protein